MPCVDPLRPSGTDDEWDVLDAAVAGTAWWLAAFGLVVSALAVVLVLLGIRKVTR